MTLNVGIIGCGNIAGGWNKNSKIKGILTHAMAYTKLSETEIVACTDLDKKKAKSFSERWDIPRFYSNHLELLKETEIDLASICTNTDTHYQITKDCIKYGKNIKAILLEKPISRNVSQAKEIVRLSEKHGIIINLDYTRIFDKNHIEIKKYLENERFGKIQCINAFYSKGILNNGSHLINLLQYFFGKIKKFEVVNSIEEFKNDPSLSMILWFENVLAPCFVVSLLEKNYSIFELDILGSNGRITIKDFGNDIRIQNTKGDDIYKDYTILDNASLKLKSTMDFALYNYIVNTIKATKGVEKPKCPAEVGLDDLMLIQKMIESPINKFL